MTRSLNRAGGEKIPRSRVVLILSTWIIGIVGVFSVFVSVRPHFMPTTARTLKSSNAKC